MYQLIKNMGRAASDRYAGTPAYFKLSPAGLTLLDALMPLFRGHCKGNVLDVGAGRGAYKHIIEEYADSYVGMDVVSSEATSVVGDGQRLPFANDSFDTVFCSQVLEHVPQPWLALAEFRRVLKPGGCLVLSVPHISWLHNEPHDYYRYTNHGLRFLLNEAGLEVTEMRAAGGLFALLGHIPSTLLINLTFGIPIVHHLAWVVNKLWVRMVANFDGVVDKKKLFALNYVCVAQIAENQE